jgi:hypothetical protein
MAERAAEEFDQMLIRRIEASKEMIQTTQQNLDVMTACCTDKIKANQYVKMTIVRI